MRSASIGRRTWRAATVILTLVLLLTGLDGRGAAAQAQVFQPQPTGRRTTGHAAVCRPSTPAVEKTRATRSLSRMARLTATPSPSPSMQAPTAGTPSKSWTS